MPILVICPECHAKFRVSEKFAGKQGPCPKCKATITVPNPEEVKIHAPEEFEGGGRDTKGRLITKPIARQETKIKTIPAVAIGLGAVATLVVVWIAGDVLRSNWLATAVGLLLIAPPLVLAGYTFLRDEEFEPHSGQSLWIRVGICSLIYTALWGAYLFVPEAAFENGWNWLFIAPPFLVAGATTAFACFDLEFTNGFFHYAFYLLVVLLLRSLAGWPVIWNVVEVAGG